MARLQAMIWYLLGRWLDSRGIAAVADKCYHIAGSKGGKYGALSFICLGEHLLAKECFKDALDAYQNAVDNDPYNANAWCSLGVTYRETGQQEEARLCFDKALEISPSHLRSETCIGELYLLQKQPELALRCFDGVIERSPRFYEAINHRITALTDCEKLAEAEHAARKAIEYFPDRADLLNKLGIVLVRSNQVRQAVPAFASALEIEPDHLNAKLNLAYLKGDGTTLMRLESFIKKKIERQGESFFLLEALGWSLLKSFKISEAEASLKRLLELDPDSARTWNTYAACADLRGDVAEAISRFKKAHELSPESDVYLSSVLFSLSCLPDMAAKALFSSHLEWAHRYEAPFLDNPRRVEAGGDPDRRLRIGYVSPDFGSHPVGDLMLGALRQHDHGRFEIHCFPTTEHLDQTAETLRKCSDYWHSESSVGASIDELAALIQTNQIDILIDLSGHTSDHRLSMFAKKPAPIQATWLGYFHSTGLSSIDYFITDPYTTPVVSGQLFSEIPVRLPNSRFCFTPPDFAPEVSRPPSERSGFITFGSFNRIVKLNDSVLDAWARIVTGVPGARLIIKDRALGDADVVVWLRRKFEARGIAPDRVILRAASGYEAMLREYSDIDIALDPFPYNGGMTTMDALWMGVPVIALVGNGVVSRQTLSLLSNIGHEELMFPDVDSYVAGAVALALDHPRLARLRSVIRPEMSRSPLCDAEQFTADLEMLYRRMWHAWCHGEKIGPEIVPGAAVARRIWSQVADHHPPDDHLLRLFQQRWADSSPIGVFGADTDGPAIAKEMIEIISATRLPESEFWNTSALGISLRRGAQDKRLVARIAFENQRGLSAIYNERINSHDSHEILIFIHDDVWIDDIFLADNVLAGLKTFNVIGVTGNRRMLPDQPAWQFIDEELTWDSPSNLSGRIAHDKHPFGTVSVYGDAPTECDLLDGVFLAARKSRLNAAKLQFDPRFTFHFHDMDFCRSARAKGLHLGTWPISLTHQSEGSCDSTQWKTMRLRYRDKWAR